MPITLMELMGLLLYGYFAADDNATIFENQVLIYNFTCEELMAVKLTKYKNIVQIGKWGQRSMNEDQITLSVEVAVFKNKLKLATNMSDKAANEKMKKTKRKEQKNQSTKVKKKVKGKKEKQNG